MLVADSPGAGRPYELLAKYMRVVVSLCGSR